MPDKQPDHRSYEQAKDILQRVLELTPGARSTYLQTACGDNTTLRAEVESLLAAHDDVNSSFLDNPFVTIDDAGPELPPEDVDLSGKRVGAYRLERLLGRGGMGAVYLASRADGEFSKHVAIKFIRTSRVSPTALKRFRAERQILADIDHPKIARLIDGGTAEGMPFFIMEYVAGDTLAQAIERGALPLDRAIDLARGVSEVLEAIHAKGLVFRDLKPSNIILNDETGVKVLDFGIAKLMQADTGEETTRSTLTGRGLIVGSPKYMSPEQAAGDEVDARSDVFSFGLVIFEALTGHLPFSGATKKEYFKKLVADDAEKLPPSVPAKLRAIVERCLKKEPDERFRSGHELADAVRKMADRPLSLAVRLALAVLIVALIGLGYWAATRKPTSNVTLLTGPPIPIAPWASNENNPRISPDMKWVSFISDRDTIKKIWIHNQASGTDQAIEPVEGQPLRHEWAPTSDQIAYVTSAGNKAKLILAPIAGGRPTVHELQQRDVTLVRWLPGGIYYLSGGALWRFDIGTAQAAEISTKRGELYLVAADVSADERHLVFSASRTAGLVRIWYSGLDAGEPVSLTVDRINPKYLRWRGTKAREVVFVSEEGDMVDIWRMDVSDGIRHQLTNSEIREAGLDVSADGTQLVYEHVKGDSHLASFSSNGGKVERITSDSLSDMFPSVSAAGRDVVFQRSKGTMTFGMRNATVRLSTDWFRSEPRVVGEGYSPEISPDGRWVVFPEVAAAPTEKLWLIDLEKPSAKPWVVTDKFRPAGYSNFPQTLPTSVLTWSSQGAFFFRVRLAGEQEIWKAEPAADVTTTRVAPVTNIGDPSAEISDLRLSADGTRLSYLLRSGGRAVPDLHVLDFARKSKSGDDSVSFPEASGIRLGCPGWLPDDSIVVLRQKDRTLTEVIVVKDRKPTVIGRTKDLNWGSAVLDPTRRVLYFARDVGVVHSLVAYYLDGSASPHERVLVENEKNGEAFSGIRVLANGQLIFALQSQNSDILSYRFDK